MSHPTRLSSALSSMLPPPLAAPARDTAPHPHLLPPWRDGQHSQRPSSGGGRHLPLIPARRLAPGDRQYGARLEPRIAQALPRSGQWADSKAKRWQGGPYSGQRRKDPGYKCPLEMPSAWRGHEALIPSLSLWSRPWVSVPAPCRGQRRNPGSPGLCVRVGGGSGERKAGTQPPRVGTPRGRVVGSLDLTTSPALLRCIARHPQNPDSHPPPPPPPAIPSTCDPTQP
jgi:hypothetical protein